MSDDRTSPFAGREGPLSSARLSRGVYLEHYLSDGGRTLLIAVDRNGHQVAWAVLPDDGVASELTTLLHAILALH